MKLSEARNTKDWKDVVEKIKRYPKGFEFTIIYEGIPKAKANCLKYIFADCIKNDLLESLQFGLDLEGNITDETFKRL